MNPGVIEGFFGKPWDWAVRLSSIDFLRDLKFRFYVYAPKAEAFLRRRWREPMPEGTLRRLSELNARGAAAGVTVGVGLTPYEIYLSYDVEARTALRSKVRQINDTGVKLLCILFDDMRGDIDGLADLQAAIVADICGWSTARQFIVCPTYYSYDVRLAKQFGRPPKAYLRDLGRIIDPAIDIFWTGEKVISDGYSAEHLIEVAADLDRLPLIWDNSISNDSRIRTEHLYLDPSVAGWKLPGDLAAGFAVNPMNQPYLTRIALCRFRHMLENDPEPDPSGCFLDLCGSELGKHLQEDADLMRRHGLGGMDDGTRRQLLARYAPLNTNPYALEVAAWLRGEYAFDPECLTT